MMSPVPVVSVVMIFLDAERFIGEAIDSVFAQTRTDWELLLIDDGSTDASTDVALRWARRHPDRVRYATHPDRRNLGMSASRNLGLQMARCPYTGFLDADDVWLSHKLERQLALFDRHPDAGMVCGPTQLWHSWTGRPDDAGRDAVRELKIDTDKAFEPPWLFDRLLQGAIRTPATCSALIRSAVARQIGGFDQEFRGLYEDQVFFAKVYRHASVYVAGECLDRYRQHPDSCCATADREGIPHYAPHHPARQRFFEWMRAYATT